MMPFSSPFSFADSAGGVLGKGDDGVSFVAVKGNVYDDVSDIPPPDSEFRVCVVSRFAGMMCPCFH